MCKWWSCLSVESADGLAPLDPTEQVEEQSPGQRRHGKEWGVHRVLYILLKLNIDWLAQLNLAKAFEGVTVLPQDRLLLAQR